jgi:hypothetical protein
LRKDKFTRIFIYSKKTIFYILDKYSYLCYNVYRMKSNDNTLASK